MTVGAVVTLELESRGVETRSLTHSLALSIYTVANNLKSEVPENKTVNVLNRQKQVRTPQRVIYKVIEKKNSLQDRRSLAVDCHVPCRAKCNLLLTSGTGVRSRDLDHWLPDCLQTDKSRPTTTAAVGDRQKATTASGVVVPSESERIG